MTCFSFVSMALEVAGEGGMGYPHGKEDSERKREFDECAEHVGHRGVKRGFEDGVEDGIDCESEKNEHSSVEANSICT